MQFCSGVDNVMARLKNDAGEGFMPTREAIKALGVSRQTVLQRVKRGELDAVHFMRGKQKGLRIEAITRQGTVRLGRVRVGRPLGGQVSGPDDDAPRPAFFWLPLPR